VQLRKFSDKKSLASAAAARAATVIRHSIAERKKARIIAATGASQFEFLEALTCTADIDWQRVEMFHLDEYVGLPETHPASFCKYLRERLIDKVGIGEYYLLSGTDDPAHVMKEVGEQLQREPIDVAFVGVGENGHLAFNDPPADFDTRELCIVPDARKAQAVKDCFEATASPMAPASALQNHANTTVYLDAASSSRLSPAIFVEQIK